MEDIPVPIDSRSGRFLDALRADLRARGYAYATERTYLHWIKRYILFHNKQHPETLGKVDIEAFLSHLAVRATV